MNAKFIITSILLSSMTLNAQTSVTLTTSNNSIKDAWVWSYPPVADINFGEANPSNEGLNNVIRSESWVWDTEADTIRGMLDFDLSAIPEGTTIIEANLSLFFYSNPDFTQQVGDNDLLIQRIVEDWVEAEVNWINQPITSTLNEVTLPSSESLVQDYPNINVTDLVQDMIDNSSMSFGFMLKMIEEEPYKGLTFASSEHIDSTLHPTLEIIYSAPASLPANDDFRNQIHFYPNPANQFLYIQFIAKNTSQVEIDICNMAGEKLIGLKEELISGKNEVRLNIESLSHGMYIITAKFEEEIISGKLYI